MKITIKSTGPLPFTNLQHVKYIRDGQYHRLDGPALTFSDGDYCWFRNGRVHRQDGPAEKQEGIETYWIDGYQVNELP